MNAFKLLSIKRELTKGGFHRHLITNATFRVHEAKELSADGPSLVFREVIQKDAYVYIEELEKVADFDFYPHTSIDIEKPASVSKNHTFIWRLPLNETLKPNQYVKHTEIVGQKTSRKDWKYPVDVFVSVSFEYHLRYQPVKSMWKGLVVLLNVANTLDIFLDERPRSKSTLSSYFDNQTINSANLL